MTLDSPAIAPSFTSGLSQPSVVASMPTAIGSATFSARNGTIPVSTSDTAM